MQPDIDIGGRCRSRIIPGYYVEGSIIPRIAKYSRHDENGCVIWTGAFVQVAKGRFYPQLNVVGYGSLLVHRLVCAIKFGNISVGLVIDHTCKNTACVNADHLEVVTQKVNVERGAAHSQQVRLRISETLKKKFKNGQLQMPWQKRRCIST